MLRRHSGTLAHPTATSHVRDATFADMATGVAFTERRSHHGEELPGALLHQRRRVGVVAGK